MSLPQLMIGKYCQLAYWNWNLNLKYFGAESFVFHVAIQKFKDQVI